MFEGTYPGKAMGMSHTVTLPAATHGQEPVYTTEDSSNSPTLAKDGAIPPSGASCVDSHLERILSIQQANGRDEWKKNQCDE